MLLKVEIWRRFLARLIVIQAERKSIKKTLGIEIAMPVSPKCSRAIGNVSIVIAAKRIRNGERESLSFMMR
jgi:hypothetical protein